jgi:hypothetical protein
MQRIRLAVWMFPAMLVATCVLAPIALAAEQEPPTVTLTAAGAAVKIDPVGGVVRSILLDGQEEMARPHPAGSDVPFAWLQVTDLSTGRTYGPLKTGCPHNEVSRHETKSSGQAEVSFAEQYEGAPFVVEQTLRQTPAGVRWEARLRLLDDQKDNHSVVVSWVLPLPAGWKFWGPSNLDVHTTDGISPFRYSYGHTDSGPMCTVIPLVGAWGKKAGAAIFSPPDVRKSQVIFEVQTQGLPDVGNGVFRRVEDLQSLRVNYHQVGLRPGKDLTLAIAIAGTQPDWRGVLGHYVNSYPALFEPIPQTRKWEGMYGITTPNGWVGDGTTRRGEQMLEARATCVEMHSHFLEYGHYISREVIDNPEKQFECISHPGNGPNSCSQNRSIFHEMMDKGVGPFVYFYNVHSLPATIEKRYPGEMMRDEQGKPLIQWETEPTVVAQPDSAFGKNLMDQIRLLIEAYPEVPGFFVDNYSIQKIDFAHDDGVTMVHNRPCYDLNRNHQDIGIRCFEIAHQAGKVMMVNKLATIESAKGADMVLVEGADPQSMITASLACVNRPFFPLNVDTTDKQHWAERMLQLLLVWGGTPDVELMRQPETMRAYRPLTDCLIGKRWVFDADPLALPAGYHGQVFRIDSHAPHGGDVVVTMADDRHSWRDEKMAEGLTVTIRLPEAESLKKGTWLGVERSQDAAQGCELTRQGQAITVKLPPMGAAGVLRLTR